MFSSFKFKSLIYFELVSCVWYKIVVHSHSFDCGYPVLSVPFIEEIILFPLHIFWLVVNY